MSIPSPIRQTALPPLRLKRNEERRLRAGHPWVFSNEVDIERTPLTSFEPGAAVEVQDYRGRPLGSGYVNPRSLISARLVSRDSRYPWSASLIAHRLNLALSLRERLFETPFYRLVYGESDGLPGLVVDRFDDLLVTQIATAGMERVKTELLAALEKLLRPSVILLRNDNPIRVLEDLPQYVEAPLGEPPEQVRLVECGVTFETPLSQGQKTGWYFDQAGNRARLRAFVQGKSVLDVFSYVGAWGVQAAVNGAEQVTCIDESRTALDYARHNAELNNVGNIIALRQGDAFKELQALHADGARYDVIVLDPPAFIKRKKDIKAGTQAYRRLNELAMRLLAKDGIIVSCSCSYHLTQAELVAQMHGAARHVSRDMQILGFGGQGPDHPIHPAIAETAYLKAVFARIVA